MIKLAANLSMLFQELPFLERFQAAARAGFRGVECMFPYDTDAEAVRERLDQNGLQQVLINTPAGDWAKGERGMAALVNRETEFRDGVHKAIAYANTIGCKLVHAVAGIPGPDLVAAEATYVENIAYAARAAAPHGITISIEPVNTRVDIPGYFLNSSSQAERLVAAIAEPNVRIQYDVYHMQVMEGDLGRTIERLLPLVGHIQIADNPGRAEPGTGEIHYPWLLERIDSLGYSGWIGCEYRPRTTTLEGLGWARALLGAAHPVDPHFFDGAGG